MKKGSDAEKAMRHLAIARSMIPRRKVEEPEPVFYRPHLSDGERVNLAAAFKDTIRIKDMTVPVPTLKIWHRIKAVAQLADLIAVGYYRPFLPDEEKKQLEEYRKLVHAYSGLRWESKTYTKIAANIVYLLCYPAHREELRRRIVELEAKKTGWNVFRRGRIALEIAELKSKLATVETIPTWIENHGIEPWQVDWLGERELVDCVEDIANVVVPQIEELLELKKNQLVTV